MDVLQKIQFVKAAYDRFERYNPFVFFFGGFTWDSFTLRRIDQLFDNILLLTYLLSLGVLVALTVLVEHGRIRSQHILKHRKWLPLALQFFLGGLFSAYVIFYFQSTSLTKTSLFLGLLVLLLVANEFLENRLSNPFLLLGLYFLASFSFFIFFVPILAKALNIFTFLSGGFLSLALTGGLVWVFYHQGILASSRNLALAVGIVVSLFGLINIFYFLNLIPPVPLSLKFGGIYHQAQRLAADNTFKLRYEKGEWYEFLKRSDSVFHYSEGDTVSCFTAVFAPTRLTQKISHHWQKYVPANKRWQTTDRLAFQIIGYRDSGYRGLTRKLNVTPGKWRVDIETAEGALLGRIGFKIAPAEDNITLDTIYK